MSGRYPNGNELCLGDAGVESELAACFSSSEVQLRDLFIVYPFLQVWILAFLKA